jgi:phage shock protein A
MSILDRLNLLVRSNLNDRIGGSQRDGAPSPVHEMEASLRDARAQLGALKGDERRIGEQLRAARQKIDQWEERALLAMRGGSEDLAREALLIKSQATEEASKLRDQLDELRSYMRDISSALEALEIKLRGTQERIQVQPHHSQPPGGLRGERDWDAELQRRLSSRGVDGAVSAQAAPPADLPPLGNAETWNTFDRISDKIDALEADVEATRALAGADDPLIDPRRAALEAKFKSMETRKRTDDDLSELKKRFSE